MKPRPIKLNEMWEVIERRDDGIAAHSRDGITVVASWGLGWDHVSVSRKNRCPDWEEMCRVKNLFWEPEECVIQYHPPKSQYINRHRFTLHMWKPQGVELPRPPIVAV